MQYVRVRLHQQAVVSLAYHRKTGLAQSQYNKHTSCTYYPHTSTWKDPRFNVSTNQSVKTRIFSYMYILCTGLFEEQFLKT